MCTETGVSLTEAVRQVPLDAFVRCHLGGMGGMEVLNLSEQWPSGCDRNKCQEWYQCLLWCVNFPTSDSVQWLTSSNMDTEGIIFKMTIFSCTLLADKYIVLLHNKHNLSVIFKCPLNK